MNTHTIGNKTVPWYREPWPWILIALPLSAVLAGVATLIIAIQNPDELVAEDYYKQGLTINRVLEREARATVLNLSAQMMFSGERVRVRIDGDALPSDHIVVRFIHPTLSAEDRETRLRPVARDWYEGVMPMPATGRWYVHLEDAEASWRLSTEWPSGRNLVNFKAAGLT